MGQQLPETCIDHQRLTETMEEQSISHGSLCSMLFRLLEDSGSQASPRFADHCLLPEAWTHSPITHLPRCSGPVGKQRRRRLQAWESGSSFPPLLHFPADNTYSFILSTNIHLCLQWRNAFSIRDYSDTERNVNGTTQPQILSPPVDASENWKTRKIKIFTTSFNLHGSPLHD